MPGSTDPALIAQGNKRPAAIRPLLLFPGIFACVVLSHLSLLHLPYFWDEGGYYVPAALDFFHTGTLIPQFTNAHPPLPSIVLGTLWHLFGFRIVVTRLTACAFAGAALTSVFFLGWRLFGTLGAAILAGLTALYPIWFAQSSLAHADIFAAGFTLAAFALYLTSPEVIGNQAQNLSSRRRLVCASALFCLSVCSKETAIVQPAALAGLELVLWWRNRGSLGRGRARLRWVAALSLPLPVLMLWYVYHYAKTGHIFGNPVYLRYNATANFTLTHFFTALRFRCVHLFWQRNMWLPLVLAGACLFLPAIPAEDKSPKGRITAASAGLPMGAVLAVVVLVVANLLAFSLLGGALLTRYLLPIYPLLLLLCIAIWRSHLRQWPWLACLTATAFVSAIWLNPSTFFAPEDNLTYRDMVVVQQDAIRYLEQHFPQATVLSAWPASAELFRPELGYTSHRFRVVSLENFTLPELQRAAQQPGDFDTALIFTTHYTTPAFRRYLLTHPESWRGRRYAADLDLSPEQVAGVLGGKVVWRENRYGEWAAILRFPRSYNARLQLPGCSSQAVSAACYDVVPESSLR